MGCRIMKGVSKRCIVRLLLTPLPDKLAFDFDPTKSGIKTDTRLYMLCMQQQKLLIDQLIMRRKKYEAESQLIRESGKYPDAHGYAIGDLVW